jgi:hypothetical protein
VTTGNILTFGDSVIIFVIFVTGQSFAQRNTVDTHKDRLLRREGRSDYRNIKGFVRSP